MPNVVQRVAKVFGWLFGAVFAGVVWYAVSVYWFRNFDQAYGPTFSFRKKSTGSRQSCLLSASKPLQCGKILKVSAPTSRGKTTSIEGR